MHSRLFAAQKESRKVVGDSKDTQQIDDVLFVLVREAYRESAVVEAYGFREAYRDRFGGRVSGR